MKDILMKTHGSLSNAIVAKHSEIINAIFILRNYIKRLPI